MQGEFNDGHKFFPDSPRVIYGHSPLNEVVCQLRFPTILRIESDVPAEFQERIRDVYPMFSRQQPGMGNLPPEVAKMIGAATPPSQYSFQSEDGAHTVTLLPDSIALTSHAYQRWERFQEFLTPVVDALIEVYRPAFFVRIGLRYQNAIIRSDLGLQDQDWSQLISSNILGELAHPFGQGRVDEAHRHLRVSSRDGREGFLLQHGFGQNTETSEEVYLVDVDFYTAVKSEIDDALPTLGRFNYRAGRAFRWCISDRMHAALLPEELR